MAPKRENIQKVVASMRLKYLSNKVKIYENRIDIYQEYLGLRSHQLRILADQKISKKQIKIERNYQKIVFDQSNKEEVFKYLTTVEATNKEQKLRLKYRKAREKGRRKIQRMVKLKKKDFSLEVENEKLFTYLQALQQKNEEEISIFIDARRKQFETEKDKLTSKQVCLEEKLKSQKNRDDNLMAITRTIKNHAEKQYAKEEVLILSKIEKFKQKFNNYSHKLLDVLTKQQKDDIRYEMAEEDVLNIHNLSMFFGGVKAVNDLSFNVKKGEIFGLIGPNGAGKTTVFNCITKFYQPTSGHLYFKSKFDEIVYLNSMAVHDVITKGIVRTFQNLEVVKEVSVLDNLLIAAHRQYTVGLFDHIFQTKKLKIEELVIRARAEKVLDFMGLKFYQDYYAWGLPYGILKKLEISRTLMNNPQLIILDEPAAGLNDSETEELSHLIREIRNTYKCSILLVEHDMGLVMDVCDRVCAISFGKMLAIGNPFEIQTNKEVQAAYLGFAEGER